MNTSALRLALRNGNTMYLDSFKTSQLCKDFGIDSSFKLYHTTRIFRDRKFDTWCSYDKKNSDTCFTPSLTSKGLIFDPNHPPGDGVLARQVPTTP